MAEAARKVKKNKKKAVRTERNPVLKVSGTRNLFGYGPDQGVQWSSKERKLNEGKSQAPLAGHLIYFGAHISTLDILREIKTHRGDRSSAEDRSHLERALNRNEEVILISDRQEPLWVIRPRLGNRNGQMAAKKSDKAASTEPTPQDGNASRSGPGLASHGGLLGASPYSRARDLCGAWTKDAVQQQLYSVTIYFVGTSDEEVRGAGVGIEMGLYRYPKNDRFKPFELILHCSNDKHSALLQQGKDLGVAVNTSRHLVNLPAGELTPKSYSEALKDYFSGSSTIDCEIWGPERLQQEKMGLLVGVGKGAEDPAHMVVLRYRPRHHKSPKRVALVGKGVTFDTGGLDIKGSDNMRLMKKDMGGSAALAGLAVWLQTAEPNFPCDIYLPLAENAVGPKAVRPGDVLRARNGAYVEIHNTDAEGRLVMADAIDVAARSEGHEHVVAIIDVATLTGAIKVALGTKLAGLFCNYDPLAELILRAGQGYGDGSWRMPLIEEYGDQLRSAVADFSNSSNSRFAGAITAALFLQKFAAGKPWAHLDIYSWGDRIEGTQREEGGSGQGVQCLVGVIERWTQHMSKL